MDTYELLLFLHVTAAIVWLGAGFTFGMLVVKAERTGDAAEVKSLTEAAEWLTPRLFIPSSLLTLIFGVLLVLDSSFYSFDQLWIGLGLGGFAVSFLVGIALIEPTAKKLHAALEEHGPESPVTTGLTRRVTLISRMELVVLYAVVAVMAAKPTADDTWLLVGLGAGVVVVWALIAIVSRPRPLEAMPAAVPTE